jgi:phi LC3 family holin
LIDDDYPERSTGKSVSKKGLDGKLSQPGCGICLQHAGAVYVFPEVTQSLVLQLMNQALTFLGLIGVIVDPTTAGIGDSERAMGYEEPWDDNR